MTAPVLILNKVDKRYGEACVLDAVDLSLNPGEIVVLIGGSGSGKTTLLRLVAGQETTDAGCVHLRGQVVDDPAKNIWTPPERRKLGMVFQDFALWPHMTALENVQAVVPNGAPSRRAAAMDLLHQLGVGKSAKRRPAQLSGGQQQRVGLARAMAAGSDPILFDEPLSSLDVDVRERMREEIRTRVRARGAAALFVSHDPLDAWRLADRVAVLERGRIVQLATPEAIYARPATARVARFTDAVGGFPIKALSHAGEMGFAMAGAHQRATAMAVGAGQPAKAYVRPCGVTTGAAGAPARLLDRTFEAGVWRCLWRLTELDWSLQSLETAPAPDDARLSLSPEHTFIYPDLEERP